MSFSLSGNAARHRESASVTVRARRGGDVVETPKDGQRRWQLRTVPRRPGGTVPWPRAGGPTQPRRHGGRPASTAEGDVGFRVLLEGPPVVGHVRRRRPGRPGRWPARCAPGASGRATSSSSSCPTGSRPASPSGPRPTSGPSSCRSSTSTAPRRSSYILGATGPDGRGDRRPLRPRRPPGHLPGRAGPPARCRTGWWWATRPAGALPPRRHPVRRPARRRARARPRRGRPRRPGGHRLHLGHDPRPEGRGPLAPHASAARPASSTTCSRSAGRRRSPAPRSATSSGCSTPSSSRCCATGRSTSSTCGTRARCCA